MIEIDAKKLIQNYLKYWSKTEYPTIGHVPNQLWYEEAGFGGYLNLYSVNSTPSGLWESYYSGYIYSMN